MPGPNVAVIADPKFDHFTRHPRGDLPEDETVAPYSRPDAVVKVSELLPPA